MQSQENRIVRNATGEQARNHRRQGRKGARQHAHVARKGTFQLEQGVLEEPAVSPVRPVLCGAGLWRHLRQVESG
jgi:hypothetical protein